MTTNKHYESSVMTFLDGMTFLQYENKKSRALRNGFFSHTFTCSDSITILNGESEFAAPTTQTFRVSAY
jgi:hypothetical protein